MINLSEATFDTAFDHYQAGRVTRRQWQQYRAVWGWSANRFGGDAGRAQERFYQRYGSDRYWQRIDAVKRYGIAIGLIKSEFTSALY